MMQHRWNLVNLAQIAMMGGAIALFGIVPDAMANNFPNNSDITGNVVSEMPGPIVVGNVIYAPPGVAERAQQLLAELDDQYEDCLAEGSPGGVSCARLAELIAEARSLLSSLPPAQLQQLRANPRSRVW